MSNSVAEQCEHLSPFTEWCDRDQHENRDTRATGVEDTVPMILSTRRVHTDASSQLVTTFLDTPSNPRYHAVESRRGCQDLFSFDLISLMRVARTRSHSLRPHRLESASIAGTCPAAGDVFNAVHAFISRVIPLGSAP